MEITYYGHSCFVIKGQELTLGFDPYDDSIGYKVPKIECDLLLVSHNHFDHSNVEAATGYHLLIDKPGEYETSGCVVLGLQTYHDEKQGEERGTNTIYSVTLEGINILHLGDIGHELSKDTLEFLPQADVLLIPVGGTYTINAEVAAKVISSLEPGIVVPMHYQTKELKLDQKLDDLDKFLNEMGIDEHKTLNKLSITKKSDIPDETEVVVLKHTA